jgi:hypothetical protein
MTKSQLKEEHRRVEQIEEYMRKVAESTLSDSEAEETLLRQYRETGQYYPELCQSLNWDIERRKLSGKAIRRLRKAGRIYDGELVQHR